MLRRARGAGLAMAGLLAGHLAWAGPVATYSGFLSDSANAALRASNLGAAQFSDDSTIANNVALYTLHLGAAGMVSFTSTGYAGGGVDPYFSVFSGSDPASATWLHSNYLQAFSTGGDFSLTEWLDAGDYTLAIGAFANMSLAENSGGFLVDGFTSLGTAYSLGSGFYSLEVKQPDDGGGTVPEPTSAALAVIALLAAWRPARPKFGLSTGER